MQGKLYIVATPIGNLEDITLRAIKVLQQVDIIAAEDTRHTLKLLNHLNISKPLISYYKQIENTKSDKLIEILLEGKDIAIVSDAGTPGISDPGEIIIKKAIENNIKVIPIPGACAMINALISSGISTKQFVFIGFLPVNNGEKKEILKKIKYETKTLIFYEAPHKIKNTLSTIYEEFGDRQCTLARELTKIHEEFIRGKLSEILMQMEDVKGEFVIIIEGNNKSQEEYNKEKLNEKTLEEHYLHYEGQGLEKKEIIKQIAKDRNVPKNEIYKAFL